MRLAYLDGLRGIFSLSVVVFHIFYIFLPTAITGDPNTAHLSWSGERILSLLPQFLYNGNCGVCVFFVLSGFVLSWRFWERRETTLLTSAALRRYIRLTAPALASILLTYLLMKAGWMRTEAVFPVAHSFPLVGEIFRFPASFLAALREGCWDIYFGYDPRISYNPVLWTMEVEMKGSFLSFAFLALFGRRTGRWFLYLVLVLLFWKTYYLSFVLGVALSDLACSSEGRSLWQRLAAWRSLSWAALGVGVLMSSYIPDGRHEVFRWMNFSCFAAHQVDSEGFYHILGAAFLVYGVLQSALLKRILAKPHLVLVGKYSFALYLVHVPVLCSLGGAVFLHFLHDGHAYGYSLALAVLASIPVIALLTYAMHRMVEKPANALAKRAEGWFAEREIHH